MPSSVTSVTPPLHTEWLTADASGPPVVLLHGFTQNARCWGPFGDALGRHHPILAVDAPGHGGSNAVHVDLPTTAALLAESIHADADGAATVVGYSMGARMGLHLALLRPDLVSGLVLIGATAGIEDDVDRAARRTVDDGLADHLLEVGLEAFLDEWLAQPLFAGLAPESACRSERLANDPAGLASSLRLAGTGTQEPLWGQLGQLDMPVLVLAGAEDPKFTAIARRLGPTIGRNATVELIEHAGHAVQLERPEATATAIERWLTAST